jgi:hypothetical protein
MDLKPGSDGGGEFDLWNQADKNFDFDSKVVTARAIKERSMKQLKKLIAKKKVSKL